MSSIIQRNKTTAKRKGALAAAATGGSVALMVVGAPVLGIVGLVGAGYLGWDWFSFRARNGMKF